MNKLNTNHPGLKVPFNWDDLAWMQNSLSEAIKGILVGLVPNGGSGFKISGCSVSVVNNNYTVSEGWIFLNGEVVYVPGNTVVPSVGESVLFTIVESDDSNGLKIGYDNLNVASNVSMYKIRIGRLSTGVSSGSDMLYGAPYFTDLISENIGWKSVLSSLSSINLTYSPAITADQSITNIVHSSNYKIIGKQLFLNINLKFDVPGANPTWYDVKLPNNQQVGSSFMALGLLSNFNGSETYICKLGISPTDSSYIRFTVLAQSLSFTSIALNSQLIINLN